MVRPLSPPLVFMIHGVAGAESPVSSILEAVVRQAQTISEATLLARIDWLLARGARFVTLSDWVDEVERGVEGREQLVALVFDDGLAEVAAAVAPRLADRAIPATIAVITGCLDLGAAPWPYRYLAFSKALAEQPGSASHDQVLDSVGVARRSERGNHDIVPWLHREGPKFIEDQLDFLEQACQLPSTRSNGHPVTIQWPALHALAAGGWEIASHSIQHPWFPLIDDAMREEEMRGSRLELEARGFTVRGFVVPRGGAADMSVVDEKRGRRCGYEYVASSIHGIARGRFFRWSIPRTSLVEESQTRFLLRAAGIVEQVAVMRDTWRAASPPPTTPAPPKRA